MSEDSRRLPSDGTPASRAPTIVLGWQYHPWWPVLHNLRRACAVRGSSQAVLLVRASARRRYRHALFPTDFSPASLAQLRLAAGILPPLLVTLLHAHRVSGDGAMQAAGVGRQAVDACLHRAERRARAAGARFMQQVQPAHPHEARLLVLARRGPWAGAVADCADLCGADLLIVGDAAGTPWRRWLHGARLCALLARTTCDLLLLPARGACAD